jgi:3-dehydroquinate synthase II
MSGKRFFWVDCRGKNTWDERKSLITASIESGADNVWVLPEDLEKAKKLGTIGFTSTSMDSDIVLVGPDSEGDGKVELPKKLKNSKDLEKIKNLKKQNKKTVDYVEIIDKEHERLAALISSVSDFTTVIGKDWKIIPLENLIAELQKGDGKIIAGANTVEGAKTVLETLEVGADGVLLQTDDINQIKAVSELIEKSSEKLMLQTAEVTTLKPLSMGDRVCIDTASILNVGEGMLIGSQARYADRLTGQWFIFSSFRDT